jgi:hypothetical protein
VSGALLQSSQILQDEINRLSEQVNQLLEQQRATREPSPAASTQPTGPVVLVFRDKHTEEVQNYALVGSTLWVFTETRSRKIPIADLDAQLTAKANDDRGIDFRLSALPPR